MRQPQPRPFVLAICTVLLMAFSALPCIAFPFRDLNPGETLPSFNLQNFKTGDSFSSRQLKGKPRVIVFWGADLPLKQQRSTAILKELTDQIAFFDQHQTQIISINIQGDQPEKITAISLDIGGGIPIYLDHNKEAYKILGIYVMPTVLLIDQAGKAVFGMGYSRNTIAQLKEEVSILLGEKTRNQLKAEKNTLKITELTPEEKKAKFHLEAGFVMEKRMYPESAIREFLTALELTPDSAVANIELGCLHIEINQPGKAEKYLAKGIPIKPDSLRGKICQAQLLAAQGFLPNALLAAQRLATTHADNHTIMALLGNMLQKDNKLKEAAAAYNKAYLLLKKSITGTIVSP